MHRLVGRHAGEGTRARPRRHARQCDGPAVCRREFRRGVFVQGVAARARHSSSACRDDASGSSGRIIGDRTLQSVQFAGACEKRSAGRSDQRQDERECGVHAVRQSISRH